MGFAYNQKKAKDAKGKRSAHTEHHSVPKRPISPLGAPDFIQAKQVCPCGGGCPRCVTALPVQAKLKIGSPGDKYEQEADRVAEEVMRMHDYTIQPKPICPLKTGSPCGGNEEEFIQTKPVAESMIPGTVSNVQREIEFEEEEEREDEELIQAKEDSGRTPEVGSVTESSINSLKGGGSPLSDTTRAYFEPRFGRDLGDVRIHTGSRAAELAGAINAQAFTHGRDVYFGSGRYKPETSSGKRLLSHELTHVVQQSGGATYLSKGKNSESSIINSHEVSKPPDIYTSPLMIQLDRIRDREGDLWYRSRQGAQRRLHQMIRIVEVENAGSFRVEWRWDPTHPETDPWNVGTRRYDSREAAEARLNELMTIESEVVSSEIRWYILKDTVLRPETQQQRQQAQTQGGRPEQHTQGSGASIAPDISLTFDDGPHVTQRLGFGENHTENVLNTLRNNGHIKAGFFVQTGVSYRGASSIGGQLITRMHDEGHTVGIHTGGTVEHERHTRAQRAGRLESELASAKSRIFDLTGEIPSYVRPPYGASNQQVQETYRRAQLTDLRWDIRGDDALSGPPTEDTLKQKVQRRLEDLHSRGWPTVTASSNVVILYHDIRATTDRYMGAIIAHIRRVYRRLTGNMPRFRAP